MGAWIWCAGCNTAVLRGESAAIPSGSSSCSTFSCATTSSATGASPSSCPSNGSGNAWPPFSISRRATASTGNDGAVAICALLTALRWLQRDEKRRAASQVKTCFCSPLAIVQTIHWLNHLASKFIWKFGINMSIEL